MYRISELNKMEVVNLCDGSRIGYICDIGVNLFDGHIESVVVNNSTSLSGRVAKRKADLEIVIPYSKIVRIGDDLVIVDIEKSV